MKRITGLVTAAVLCTAAGAHAESVKPKSRRTAFTLAIAGTATSQVVFSLGLALENRGILTLAGAGLLVTPSLGEIYSGEYVTAGMLARGAGMGLLALGMGCTFGSNDQCGAADGALIGSVLVGGGLLIAGAVVDIVRSGRAASEFNRAHGFALAPTAIVTPSGTSAAMGFSGRF